MDFGSFVLKINDAAKESAVGYASSITFGTEGRNSGCSPSTAKERWQTCL